MRRGCAWTQSGSIAATVTSVANEPRDGQVRVEFAVDRQSAPRIPFQHGLPGSVEMTLARVAPATVRLRTVGKYLRGVLERPQANPLGLGVLQVPLCDGLGDEPQIGDRLFRARVTGPGGGRQRVAGQRASRPQRQLA